MATIRERNGKFCVIYYQYGSDGKRHQKWETYKTRAEAVRRKREIEYKTDNGTLFIPKCITLNELLEEYVNLYGKDRWALSTYDRNVGLIHNYISPVIGDTKLTEINTRFLERFYRKLQGMRPAEGERGKRVKDGELIGASVIRDIHKLLRNCFEQAVKWEMIEKNPAINAIVEKSHGMRMVKCEKRIAAIQEKFGAPLTREELEGLRGSNPSKPQFGELLAEHGLADSQEEGIKLVDGLGVTSDSLGPKEAIEGIIEAGGVPVLAHPPTGKGSNDGIYRPFIRGEELESRIRRLTEYGLQGVEAIYSAFDKDLMDEVICIADRYGLYVTAGSDYHGKEEKAGRFIRLGVTGLELFGAPPEGLIRFLDRIC